MDDLNVNPCKRLTTDAIGKPGQRTFFLQGENEDNTITLIYEKIQLQSLIVVIVRFFENLHEKYPSLPIENGNFQELEMQIIPPVDPLFRVGELSINYEQEHDQVCLIAKEIVFEQSDIDSNLDNQNYSRTVNFWCSRDQLSQFANWGVTLLQRGRPICPLCNQPMDPEGHLCPKKNGHKKH